MTWKDKLKQIQKGAVVLASSEDLDRMEPFFPSNVASIPNPDQTGILDQYVVGPIDSAPIHEWRVKNGLTP